MAERITLPCQPGACLDREICMEIAWASEQQGVAMGSVICPLHELLEVEQISNPDLTPTDKWLTGIADVFTPQGVK